MIKFIYKQLSVKQRFYHNSYSSWITIEESIAFLPNNCSYNFFQSVIILFHLAESSHHCYFRNSFFEVYWMQKISFWTFLNSTCFIMTEKITKIFCKYFDEWSDSHYLWYGWPLLSATTHLGSGIDPPWYQRIACTFITFV